jgi:hypothetical protein
VARYEPLAVKKPSACLIAYELPPHGLNIGITTIDQFGLNQLKARSDKRLCVPSELVNSSSPGGE